MIKLPGGYAIKALSDCWQFGRWMVRRDNKTGDMSEVITGKGAVYTTTLAKALDYYVRYRLLDSDPDSFLDVRRELSAIEDDITALGVREAAYNARGRSDPTPG